MSHSTLRRAIYLALKFCLPLAVSVLLCYYLFRDMNFSEMVDEIRNDCNFAILGASLLFGFLSFIIRAARWRIQLAASDIRPPLHAVTYSIIGTYALNIIIPRIGELWRSQYIASRQRAPFPTVFGSMVADRLADTISVLLIFLASLCLAGAAIHGFIANYPATYEAILGVVTSPVTYIVIALLAVTLWLLMRRPRSGFVGRAQRAFRGLLSGFMAIFRMKGKGRWLLLTVIIWVCYFVQMLLVFESFGYAREILHAHGLVVVLVCFALSSISMGIPSNGGFGPYQLAIIFGLECFIGTADITRAGAFANLVLGAQTFLTVICGLVVFILIALEKRQTRPPKTAN